MTGTLEVARPARARRLRRHLADSLVITRRSLAHIRQTPERLLDVTVQPLMFVLLFGFVFGGVVSIPGGSYREYLLGGILVQSIAFGIVGPASALSRDLTEGIVDRFRTLPMSRSSFLLGHMLAALAAMALAIAVLSLSGLVVGWNIHAGVLDGVEGYGLLIAFAFTMLWVGAFIGVSVRTPDAVTGIAFLVIFPVTFLASTLVPIDGLPAGLRDVAAYNPVSALALAARTLFGNPTALPADPPWPLEHPVASSLAWCAALLAVVVPLTVRRFRAKTTD